jgi:hypothetical protein
MRQKNTARERALPSVRRQLLGRRLRSEALEPRRMLVTLTIITPDEGGSYPAWAYDMATAIVAKEGVFDSRDLDGDGVADFVQKTRIEYGKPLPFPDSGTYSDDVMLLDWSAISSQPGSAGNFFMVQFFRDALQFRLQDRNEATHDLHFIGHGRGAFLNMALVNMLVDQPTWQRLGYIQMTTLDAYSREDGNLFAYPGDLADFADNYYQTSGPKHGAPLELALNFDLSERLAAWPGRTGEESGHEEVHDWYHWTIASQVNAPDRPALKDANLAVPTSADRVLLYDEYSADLNADGQPDDFRSGARIGYYFTVNGGGIGHVLNVDNDRFSSIYTFDVRTGELPLYLGRLNTEDAAQITFAPTGKLYVTGDDLQFAESPMYFIDDFGPWRSLVDTGEPWGPSAPFARRFSRGGRLAHVVGDTLAEIDPVTTEVEVQLSLNWGGDSSRTAAFDVADDLYLIRVPESGGVSQLIRFDTATYQPQTLGEIPYDDVISTSVIDGLLYCFREAGQYFSVNLTTLQIIERGRLDLSDGYSLASMASISSSPQPRWHNRDQRNDVNGDGRINSSDALTLINSLLIDGSRQLNFYPYFSYYYDTTNDGRINTSDILAVINQILLGSAPAASDPLIAADAVPLPSQPVAATSTHHAYNWIAFAASLEIDSDDESELGWLT